MCDSSVPSASTTFQLSRGWRALQLRSSRARKFAEDDTEHQAITAAETLSSVESDEGDLPLLIPDLSPLTVVSGKAAEDTDHRSIRRPASPGTLSQEDQERITHRRQRLIYDATHDPHANAVIDSVSCVASDNTELFHASTTNAQGQGKSIPIVHNDESKNESDVLRLIPRDETLSSTLQDAESLGDSSTPNDCPVTTVSGVESRSEDLDQTAPFTHSWRNSYTVNK